MPLSIRRSDFKHDWEFQHAVYELVYGKAKRSSGGNWNVDAFERVLPPIEFDTFLVLNFVAKWENGGDFIDAVECYEDEFNQLDRAFRRMGFSIASVLMPRCLELYALNEPYYREGLPLPADLEEETERINSAANTDVSEERLTKAIMDRIGEFEV